MTSIAGIHYLDVPYVYGAPYRGELAYNSAVKSLNDQLFGMDMVIYDLLPNENVRITPEGHAFPVDTNDIEQPGRGFETYRRINIYLENQTENAYEIIPFLDDAFSSGARSEWRDNLDLP